jgi:RNA polymerase sigma-70 factor (ECF subfamily)
LELAALLKEGENGAFKEIYERYFGLLYIHAYKRLGNEEEAKDVVQDLFANLWAKRESLFLKTNISNYLYTAVRNRVFDVISHKQVESAYFSNLPQFIDSCECQTDYRIREEQLAAMIEKEIQSLPPRMREVFELSRKANLTHKEIALQLNLSEQSVRSHIKNALKSIKSKFGFFIYLLFITQVTEHKF